VGDATVNVARGLLCIWSIEFVALNNAFQNDGYIGLEGIGRKGKLM